VDISYLQATAIAGKPAGSSVGFEPLPVALLFSLAIWYLRGDQFLTGGLALVVLGQSTLLPFLNQLLFSDRRESSAAFGLLAAMGLICFGLYRILGRAGGSDFVDRFALLNLLAILPQSALWLAFRMRYPFFGTRFLLMLLLPIYVGSLVVSAMPRNFGRDLKSTMRTPVSPVEIFASLVLGSLLFAAIGLTTRAAERQHIFVARGVPQLPSA
jgi:hypothetical protein